ncbi:MAG: sorbosone dehydrogenase [Parcubacteria group bacterium Gr01-1014_18]|nr:MAG: sorbosone dehydrogenase [Parcubacteria group bacterium Greene0416_36]TSC81428.1 MAG: sorbosone dehydrogenase [Parcubacteria group bacterium Gr01-1014_18]TSC99026.1 MAG: sorbosone dehydrogenase [Parcubacteria group bacterium Greene1014_20]TSD07293.1 MAG: sorbosone dehydrogenase [Parcubacteria group bacterium Greene0714_2]
MKIFGYKKIGGIIIILVCLAIWNARDFLRISWHQATYKGGFEHIKIGVEKDFANVESFSKFVAASGLEGARSFIFGDRGEIYVTDSAAGKIWVLRDMDRDLIFESRQVFAENFVAPEAIVSIDGKIYVGDKSSGKTLVFKITDVDGDFKADQVLPLELGLSPLVEVSFLSWLPSRKIFYVGTVSRAKDDSPKIGQILRFDLDGRTFGQILTTPILLGSNNGFSTPVAMVEHPHTGDLIVLDRSSGREEELNMLFENRDYGAPKCFGRDWENLCPDSIGSLYEFPLDMGISSAVLYTGTRFPEEFGNNILMVSIGVSSGDPSLSKNIIRLNLVPFNASYDVRPSVFATGFSQPTDIEVGGEGDIYVLDAEEGEIYRIGVNYRK